MLIRQALAQQEEDGRGWGEGKKGRRGCCCYEGVVVVVVVVVVVGGVIAREWHERKFEQCCRRPISLST